MVGGVEKHRLCLLRATGQRHAAAQGCFPVLPAEAVQGATLALERVHHIERGHSLALGVLGVGHGVANDVLQKHLQHATRLLIDEATNSLDAPTTRQAPDGGLGDTLDVVSQHLAVALGASLAQPLASLAAS